MTNLVGLREALQNLVNAVEKADNMIDEGLSANHPAMEAARSALEPPAGPPRVTLIDGPAAPGMNRDELLAAEINALPERVRRWIHILESDPAAGDKWRLLEAQQNIAGLTAEVERLRALTEPKRPLEFRGDSEKVECPLCAGEGSIFPPNEHPPTAPQRGTLEPPAQAIGEGADTEVPEKLSDGEGA